MTRRDELLSVLANNLAIFKGRDQEVRELRGITVRQLADALCEELDPDPEECFSSFCRLLPDATVEEQLLLCQILLSHNILYDSPLPCTIPSPLKIACMEAPAHQLFLSRLGQLAIPTEPVAVSGFTQGCEEVLDEKSNGCILPLFSTADGKLYRFYDMLERYDLNILAACDVDSPDGGQTVRYALAGYPEQIDLRTLSLPRCLEFSVTEADSDCIRTVMEAVTLCQGTRLLVDSLPLPFGTGMHRFYFTLHLPADAEDLLRLYLSLRFPGYTVIGAYPLLPRASLL